MIDLQIVIYIIIGFLFLGGIPATIVYLRTKYTKELNGPPACLVAEFWPPRGRRYRVRVPIEPDGYTIRAPEKRGHRCPVYFFDKNAIFGTPYPERPFLPISYLQIDDAPTVSWAVDNPEPIDPYRPPGQEIMTSEMLDIYKDKSFSLLMTAASERIAELETQLQKALIAAPVKTYVYAGLIIASLASIAAAILGFIINQGMTKLLDTWG